MCRKKTSPARGKESRSLPPPQQQPRCPGLARPPGQNSAPEKKVNNRICCAVEMILAMAVMIEIIAVILVVIS